MPEVKSAAPADVINKAAELLRNAKHPVMLAGRVSRDLDAWNARVALAERLNARVVTDMKVGAAFPTDHALHAGSGVLAAEVADAIRAADVIFVVDHGQIAERGSHDELIEHNGLYARLYEEQFGAGTVQAFCSDGIVLADGRCVRPAMASEATEVEPRLGMDGGSQPLAGPAARG